MWYRKLKRKIKRLISTVKKKLPHKPDAMTKLYYILSNVNGKYYFTDSLKKL